MTKGRLEAFSDGVLAIILTIMVLELRVPHDPSWTALKPLLLKLLSYLLSFVFVGIYWNHHHHHLLHAVHKVNGRIMWANLHLLFWLSLIPFATGWMGENRFAAAPVALYGGILLLASIAFNLLVRALLAHHGPDSTLARAPGSDLKGKLSIALYAAAIPLAFLHSLFAAVLFVVVAILWLVPDSRIEKSVV